jgi:hypothetical protein
MDVWNMSSAHLAWLNKHYRLRQRLNGITGNDGTIERITKHGRRFVEKDLRRCVSSLALDPSSYDTLQGFGVTRVDEPPLNENTVSLYDVVTARMLGL